MTEEMQRIAVRTAPLRYAWYLSGGRKLTTEGGLDAAARIDALREFIRPMRGVGSRVSLFIDAEPRQIEAACRVEAAAVEFHTGSYCDAHERGDASERDDALERIRAGARMAAEAGLEVHAGHGLPL